MRVIYLPAALLAMLQKSMHNKLAGLIEFELLSFVTWFSKLRREHISTLETNGLPRRVGCLFRSDKYLFVMKSRRESQSVSRLVPADRTTGCPAARRQLSSTASDAR